MEIVPFKSEGNKVYQDEKLICECVKVNDGRRCYSAEFIADIVARRMNRCVQKEKETEMKTSGIIETAKALKVPSEWLKKQAEDGLVPAIQFGSRWRFDIEAVRKNIENRLKN